MDIGMQRMRGDWAFGIVFGVVFAGLLIVLLANRTLTGKPGKLTPEVINHAGNVQSIGTALYTSFLFPVEVTSVLLLVAAVGAVYLAMRRMR
jgi:NADH-quinone oxidoreductase subunit J